MRKGKNGITLISLVVTIVIILILTATIITNVYTGSDYKKYKLMCADVEFLEDKILIYYNNYGELPLLDKVEQNLPPQTNSEHEYYKIDVNKLTGITLNYGDEEDVFIIDTSTFEVYYLNGIEYMDTMYYTD